jgi:hypothetical protein
MVHAHADALLDAVLTPEDAPLLHEAVASLLDLLRDCDLDPRTLLGAASSQELLRKNKTLRALGAAGLLDAQLLRVELEELASPAMTLAAERVPAVAEVDRFLVAPVLLGLARLPGGGADLPAWLIDAGAALIAVDAWRPLVAPEMAPEALLQGPGCHTDPRLARLLPAGHLLARTVGFESLVQGIAGQGALLDALDGATLDAAEALTRPGADFDGPSLASWTDTFGEQDAAWLEDMVQLLCVRRRREHGLPRAVQSVPDGGGFVLDLQTCQVRSAQSRSLAKSVAEGWLDAPPAALPVPPAACGALVRAGWPGLVVRLQHAEALDDLAEVLFDLCDQPDTPHAIHGDGFVIEPLVPVASLPIAAAT